MDSNKYNPEGSPLREHQKKLLDLLCEFSRLCEENDIVWWIDAGTLLGAVRHGGFVPWDDDLDVCILWKDLPRIRKILCEKTPAPYAFKDRRWTRGYAHLWPRFVNENCKIVRRDAITGKPVDDELWIDTFTVRPTSPRLKAIIDPLYGRCLRRVFGMIDDGPLKKTLAYLLYPFSLLLVGLSILEGRLFHRNSLMYDFGVPFYGIRNPKEIFPLQQLEFEGHLFPAPADTDHYLRRLYGDWTKLPPEEKRISHEIIFK